MRKLPLIWLAAVSLAASVAAVGQGCGSSDSTGGGGPGGGTAGGTSTNPTGGGTSTTNTSTNPGGGGSSSTTSDNGGGGSSTQGTGGSGGAGGASCAGVELTVHNIAAWCDVGVNGGAASVASTQTVCVDASKKVPLTATGTGADPQHPSFVIAKNMWHHVDDSNGDTGVAGNVNGANTESDETKTVGASGTACVWVCCPGANDPTECDVGGAFVPTDPCAGN